MAVPVIITMQHFDKGSSFLARHGSDRYRSHPGHASNAGIIQVSAPQFLFAPHPVKGRRRSRGEEVGSRTPGKKKVFLLRSEMASRKWRTLIVYIYRGHVGTSSREILFVSRLSQHMRIDGRFGGLLSSKLGWVVNIKFRKYGLGVLNVAHRQPHTLSVLSQIFCTKNDMFKLIIAIPINWHFSKDILTIIDC